LKVGAENVDELGFQYVVSMNEAVHADLPTPTFSAEEKQAAAGVVCGHIWQQAVSGGLTWAA
jgi:hypothetical protein